MLSLPGWVAPAAVVAAIVLGKQRSNAEDRANDAETRAKESEERVRNAEQRADKSDKQAQRAEARILELEEKLRASAEAGRVPKKPTSPRKTDFPKSKK